MLRADTSPVQDRIKRLKDMVFPGKIQFSACNNTKQGMEKAEGHAISDRARRHHRSLRRRPSDGIAGAGLELRPAVRACAVNRGFARYAQSETAHARSSA